MMPVYTHGPGIDNPLVMYRGGHAFYYVQDRLGSVVGLVTIESGGFVQKYTYDAWGNIVEQSGDVKNPYTYTGREYDPESGLYYYRARYYDSAVGRFLQRDPIGVRGGVNLYLYMKGEPVNNGDPWGMWWGSGWVKKHACKLKATAISLVIAGVMAGIGYILGTTAFGEAGPVFAGIFSGLTPPIAWYAEYKVCMGLQGKAVACQLMVYAFSTYCILFAATPWALNLCYAIMAGISIVVCPLLR